MLWSMIALLIYFFSSFIFLVTNVYECGVKAIIHFFE